MNKVTNYFRESYKELMEKVTWPTWSATSAINSDCFGCYLAHYRYWFGVMDVFSQWYFKIHLFIIILMETINQVYGSGRTGTCGSCQGNQMVCAARGKW